MAEKIETLVGEAESETMTGHGIAFDLIRYTFARDGLAVAPRAIGEALEAGTAAAEAELGLAEGEVFEEAVKILEGVLEGFRSSLLERFGGDAQGRPEMDWVSHAIEYYLAHGKFPEDAPKGTIALAVRALAKLPKK